MTTNYEPKIHTACLASYNNGFLYGKWIDANQDVSALEEEIQEILADSPMPDAEEWAIHDYEDFDNLGLSEYESLETISQVAQNIVEHGELFIEAYRYTNNIDEAIEMINDRFIGLYDSVEDYAEETTDISSIPEYLRYYIDFESLARDIELSGDIKTFEIDNQIAVFF
ncbi:antirestriction protein ArdA [Francisella tularensis]|uniref:antirestriction protein ArdA n=1 Tax=Francisella tularensis TaxID=263 RepID=UPI0000F59055|nr:antirestriction protein ArdA [Francisella tularensis]ABO47128.1 putative antirestriction protein [Francisella tularensis subsp. tularensis WY96-3418]AJI62631.1 antirestriction family protein [Francisella tularensis subsp. tularensis]AKH91775.1 antirestriction protein [Francisella tularensis subsp. tularensis WY-00W4114]AKU74540.1 antirestriction family protein [Francisella tularensis subsp. tularensis]EKM85968.1 putative antirestriction protein [Francisella tularensis subsp. tularensis 831]